MKINDYIRQKEEATQNLLNPVYAGGPGSGRHPGGGTKNYYYGVRTKYGKPVTTGSFPARHGTEAMERARALIKKSGKYKGDVLRVHLSSPEEPLVHHYFDYKE